MVKGHRGGEWLDFRRWDEVTDGATDTPEISIEAGIEQYLGAAKTTKSHGTRFIYDVPELG
jgi:hypothetical protein